MVSLASPFGASQEFTTRIETEATVAIALGWDSKKGGYPALFEISVISHTANILDNGSEIGARFTLRGSQDNPRRQAGGGRIESLGTVAIPGIHTDVKFTNENIPDSGPRARIETAFLYLDGGYGEVSVGRDIGIAARLYEGPRSIFSHARDTDALLDPSGLSIIRSRLDWSGNSAKFSYVTPRLVGIRFGLSYTPSTEADGLDRSLSLSLGDEITDIWEGGINYLHTSRNSGLRYRVGVVYSTSSIPEELTKYVTKIDGWSAGVRIEGTRTSFGFSLTSADEGRVLSLQPLNAEDRSTVWGLGFEHKVFGSDFSATIASLERSSDDLSSISWSTGVKREVAKGFLIGGGIQGRKIELDSRVLDSVGGIIELTQRW